MTPQTKITISAIICIELNVSHTTSNKIVSLINMYLQSSVSSLLVFVNYVPKLKCLSEASSLPFYRQQKLQSILLKECQLNSIDKNDYSLFRNFYEFKFISRSSASSKKQITVSIPELPIFASY